MRFFLFRVLPWIVLILVGFYVFEELSGIWTDQMTVVAVLIIMSITLIAIDTAARRRERSRIEKERREERWEEPAPRGRNAPAQAYRPAPPPIIVVAPPQGPGYVPANPPPAPPPPSGPQYRDLPPEQYEVLGQRRRG